MTNDATWGIAPWDGKRVPVTLLGGYLGSGKTTVINELLARTERPIALLVNDVGEVNVDANLVRRHNGDTIELTDGCVCCSLSRGLVEAFDEIRARPEPPDHVVVELSGVADPRRVAPWADSIGFRLDGTVVLVDSEQFLSRIDDDILSSTVAGQVEAADVLVLTKTDLVTPDVIQKVRDRLVIHNRRAPIFEPGSPGGGAAFVLTATRLPGGFSAMPDPGLFDAHQVRTVPLPDPISTEALQLVLDELPANVLRAKAVTRDTDGSLHLVQVVGHRQSIVPLPQAEGQPCTDLVVVEPRGSAVAMNVEV